MKIIHTYLLSICTAILTLLSANAFASAQVLLKFNYKEGQIYHIEGYVNEDLYKNDEFIKSVRLKNIGSILIKKFDGHKALHEGIFRYYESPGQSDNFQLKNEYPTKFYRDIYGNYDIERSYFMPVVRGVPTFPEVPVDIGDQWQSKAFEVHDFRKVYGIEKPVVFPAYASYQYLGNKITDGKNIAKISINYVINYTLRYQNGIQNSIPLPYRIIGYFNQLYFWNLDKGLPDSYKENFDYIFIMADGEILEYTGKSGAACTVEEPGQDAMVGTIEKKLHKTMPQAEVTRTSEGIVINIGEILFKFDSDELTQNASKELDNIVEVLKDFPRRKIRVIGHTDNTGTEEYNLSLSLRRAKKTVDELKNRILSLKDRITYVGMGESMPIASNSTEKGRRKNRRVEIIILKNKN